MQLRCIPFLPSQSKKRQLPNTNEIRSEPIKLEQKLKNHNAIGIICKFNFYLSFHLEAAFFSSVGPSFKNKQFSSFLKFFYIFFGGQVSRRT